MWSLHSKPLREVGSGRLQPTGSVSPVRSRSRGFRQLQISPRDLDPLPTANTTGNAMRGTPYVLDCTSCSCLVQTTSFPSQGATATTSPQALTEIPSAHSGSACNSDLGQLLRPPSNRPERRPSPNPDRSRLQHGLGPLPFARPAGHLFRQLGRIPPVWSATTLLRTCRTATERSKPLRRDSPMSLQQATQLVCRD